MMTVIKESRAYKYAEWCVQPENDKVGVYVKRQAKQWLDIADGNNPDAYVSQKQWKKITKILKLIIHPDVHQNMYDSLEDYAILFIYAIFCTKNVRNDKRYYETGLLLIARKNFKTFTSAVIFIIGLLTEPKFSRFFSVAPDLSLSSELREALNKIIKSSPLLNDDKIFKILGKEIRCKITESKYIPLAYSNDRLDGKLANMFLADECGGMDNYPIEAMRSSQIFMEEKLGIIISTKYPNDNNGMIDEVDMSKKAIDGLLDEETRFSLIYEPDSQYQSGDAWQTSDTAIYQANPCAVKYKHLFDALVKKRKIAVLYEDKRENFICKHLNISYKGLGSEGYVDVSKVKLCRADDDIAFWTGRDVFIGLDLSQTDDNTSVAMITYDYESGRIYAKVWGFIPSDKLEHKSQKEHVNYNKLIEAGECFACGDEVIDYGFVERFVLSLEEKYGVNVIQLGYDRYNAISSVQKFESAENPIECVEIKQHSSVLHRATKLLREQILSQTFVYFSNRMLEINFSNARCTRDTNLNQYVNKKKSAGKVDMVVSLINAIFLLQVNVLDGAEGSFAVQIEGDEE